MDWARVEKSRSGSPALSYRACDGCRSRKSISTLLLVRVGCPTKVFSPDRVQQEVALQKLRSAEDPVRAETAEQASSPLAEGSHLTGVTDIEAAEKQGQDRLHREAPGEDRRHPDRADGAGAGAEDGTIAESKTTSALVGIQHGHGKSKYTRASRPGVVFCV
ncbi:hypothetical protein CH63R_02172 [Colletotrichum higginsianum IMI 349063]|uniref:Uncharacterized protein n=1 Tax=Colletotrichum higginsianum (strain IMI 349063) TaxID=759273 RepID=A0A1B7YN19_COLHI|nr:hypothetical protein CH63R_02172 [Colletotrichum higginsianum IMI 349063]OBR13446.1 hypothetical protein CH63R_02172 [Colletotrichum higginsianum IMI 349063]